MLPAMSAFGSRGRIAELDPEVGAGAGPGGDADRAAQAFDDVLGDGEAEAGAGAPGGEVWIEDARQVIVGDAVAVSRMVMATRRSPSRLRSATP